MEPHAITGELGPQQVLAAGGPVDQYGPEMLTYNCSNCGAKFADVGLYFYGISSTKCIWCTKFPKAKNVRSIK
jgi:DNA-directed RNA polymerase subunit RPC12/RpoP